MALDVAENKGPGEFASTRWSLVLAAGRRSVPASDEALAILCQAYWYPLYAFARRRLGNIHEAQDATQAFFANLLEKNILAVAHPDRGRFRAFLLTAFRNFLANRRDQAHSQKRGGYQAPLSLDFQAGNSRYDREATDASTPGAHVRASVGPHPP